MDPDPLLFYEMQNVKACGNKTVTANGSVAGRLLGGDVRRVNQ
jgi:hypothetical protein